MDKLSTKIVGGIVLLMCALLLNGFFTTSSAVARLDVKVDGHIQSSVDLEKEKVKNADYKFEDLKNTLETMRTDRKEEVDKLNKRLDNILMLIQAYGKRRIQ